MPLIPSFTRVGRLEAAIIKAADPREILKKARELKDLTPTTSKLADPQAIKKQILWAHRQLIQDAQKTILSRILRCIREEGEEAARGILEEIDANRIAFGLERNLRAKKACPTDIRSIIDAMSFEKLLDVFNAVAPDHRPAVFGNTVALMGIGAKLSDVHAVEPEDFASGEFASLVEFVHGHDAAMVNILFENTTAENIWSLFSIVGEGTIRGVLTNMRNLNNFASYPTQSIDTALRHMHLENILAIFESLPGGIRARVFGGESTRAVIGKRISDTASAYPQEFDGKKYAALIDSLGGITSVPGVQDSLSLIALITQFSENANAGKVKDPMKDPVFNKILEKIAEPAKLSSEDVSSPLFASFMVFFMQVFGTSSLSWVQNFSDAQIGAMLPNMPEAWGGYVLGVIGAQRAVQVVSSSVAVERFHAWKAAYYQHVKSEEALDALNKMQQEREFPVKVRQAVLELEGFGFDRGMSYKEAKGHLERHMGFHPDKKKGRGIHTRLLKEMNEQAQKVITLWNLAKHYFKNPEKHPLK
jgi:hypothetical protein